LLRGLGVERLFIGGLATDYCVKFTAFDGMTQGFTIVVLTDAIRGVNLDPSDSEQALAEMHRSGAATLESIDELPI
jgi:nicotinamidase/pyrazinamidase